MIKRDAGLKAFDPLLEYNPRACESCANTCRAAAIHSGHTTRQIETGLSGVISRI